MPDALPGRITTTLPLTDTARAKRVRERVGDGPYEAWGEGADFLDAVFAAAPYLGRLAAQRRQTLERLAKTAPETLIKEACEQARQAGRLDDEAAVMAALRQAKADLHLTAALADLAGAFSLEGTVQTISDFADAAVQASLEAAVRLAGLEVEDPDNPMPGLFVLTLGKHGQRSLNYSSDVDLAVFWEPETTVPPPGRDPVRALDRLVKRMVHLLNEITADGYVFRVDLRLRPDPSSTPLAVNAEMARHYFEAVGQNWERAAYAKARLCAGDRAAGAAFLKDLEPFIWRRALDYAAVDDIRALAKQIQAVGKRSRVQAGGHDLKLGRGGIREIEFFAQVLQLVFGGRRPVLRPPGTLQALDTLAAEALISSDDARALAAAYRALRALEHRIQMLEDEQTQTVPIDDAVRVRLAALTGEGELAAFDARLTDWLTDVHARFTDQFEDGASLATEKGSLVLTGVEPTPDTRATLEAYGFSDPDRVWERLAGWAAGKARAARTERARALFSRFAPRLVEGLAASGDPDAALSRFAAFFEGLPSGVQPLSLLINQPALARELIAILGLAPRLAEILARRPALMDVMLDPAFAAPLREDAPGRQRERFAGVSDTPFEDALNAARRLAMEERLRIGAQLLLARATATEAGRAFADLADAAVEQMARAAETEVARRHGPAPGRWAVLGLGKLGGRELSADSDLDLMVIYEADAARSDGPKPLMAQAWFVRFTQRLVTALSSPTEEGELYPVDMALRPSGSAGPIAVRLSRFKEYYESGEAWTWERMALTRGRVVAHDGLKEAVDAAVRQAVGRAAEPEQIRADACAMRARLLRDKPAKSDWDLKLRTGGLIEIEFIAQTAQLIQRAPVSPNTREALRGLAEDGALPAADADVLDLVCEDYAALTQLIRAAHGGGFDPDRASAPFAARLCAALDAADMAGLEQHLASRAGVVRGLFQRHVGDLQRGGDGNGRAGA